MVSWMNQMMTIKVVLISSGFAFVGLLLKVFVPVAVDFSVSRAPILWSSLLSWLKPPYLYVLTNGIIITIVASSRFYRGVGHREDDEIVYGGDIYKIHTEPIVHQASNLGFVVPTPDVEELKEFEPEAATAVVFDDEEEKITDAAAMVEDVDEIEEELKRVVMVESSHKVVLPPILNLPPRMTKSENLPPTEKPLVSSRFGHRKLVKASPQGGKALRVTKPKRNETLENTWKMITEGKSTNRQLYRRSDTFGRGDSGDSETKLVYKKSETFRDRTNYYKSQETETATEKAKKGKKRKEPSLSQDELNRRVEAFIKKFNEEMRLQRMESLRQYKEITSPRV